MLRVFGSICKSIPDCDMKSTYIYTCTKKNQVLYSNNGIEIFPAKTKDLKPKLMGRGSNQYEELGTGDIQYIYSFTEIKCIALENICEIICEIICVRSATIIKCRSCCHNEYRLFVTGKNSHG